MVAQESDIGVSRRTAPSAPMELLLVPGAYHKFDDPRFQSGRRYMGHLLKFDAAAMKLAADRIRVFLRAELEGR